MARMKAPKEGNAMASQDTSEGHGQGHPGQGNGGLPSPGAMLGIWTSWVQAMSGSAGQGWADPAKPWWQMTGDHLLGGALAAGGTGQLGETLAKDPFLRSVDRMWNANPLRDVVPVDWAEVARALRTVWLRSLARPGAAMPATAELNANLWRSALDAWNEAGRRWWEGAGAAAPAGGGGGDKRFAAPEWHTNPAYRVLKEAYLLASDWLLNRARRRRTAWTRRSGSGSTSTSASSWTP
jgi:polyhydroxyalkanoate synthase